MHLLPNMLRYDNLKFIFYRHYIHAPLRSTVKQYNWTQLAVNAFPA
jgi:hypothetical protein